MLTVSPLDSFVTDDQLIPAADCKSFLFHIFIDKQFPQFFITYFHNGHPKIINLFLYIEPWFRRNLISVLP